MDNFKTNLLFGMIMLIVITFIVNLVRAPIEMKAGVYNHITEGLAQQQRFIHQKVEAMQGWVRDALKDHEVLLQTFNRKLLRQEERIDRLEVERNLKLPNQI